jgi:predicted phosphate transport protein (TIGR00153 family)
MRLFNYAPNRKQFFDLLQDAGENAARATEMVADLIATWPDRAELRAEIKERENDGDRITHDIIHALHSSSATPLDREDIHALASALDDVVDLAEESADFLGLYRIEAPMVQAQELSHVLRDAGREVARAMGNLDDTNALTAHVRELGRLEDEGDVIARQGLTALFDGGVDPVVIIRWKDVYDRLEQAVDACEHVGHILEGIVVKQS